MRMETLAGLQKRTEMFLENCLAIEGRDPDVYVRGPSSVRELASLTQIGLSALLRARRSITTSL